jgi:hypothetical protein
MRLTVKTTLIISFFALILSCGKSSHKNIDSDDLKENYYQSIAMDIGPKYLLSQVTSFPFPNKLDSTHAVLHLPYSDTSFFGIIIDSSSQKELTDDFEIIDKFYVLTSTIFVFMAQGPNTRNWDYLQSRVGSNRLSLFYVYDLEIKANDTAEFIGSHSCGRRCGSTNRFFVSKKYNLWSIDSIVNISIQ